MPRAAIKKVRGVFEHPPGSNCWWVHHYDANGQRHREKVGRRGDAIDLYTKRKQQALAGVKLPEKFRSAAVKFDELADMTLAYSKSNKADYKHDVQRMTFILESFAGKPAEKITPRDVEQWLSEEADENEWSPATFNRYKALWSLTFRVGMENGKVTQNPARLVKRRREDNTRVRWLLDEEEPLLRDVISDSYAEHMPEFDIAIHCGMRKSEQYSLTWPDIDFSNRILTVRKSKNGEMRHIKLNPIALEAFRILRDRTLIVSMCSPTTRVNDY
jgi:integrase